jgi:peroxiredoxin
MVRNPHGISSILSMLISIALCQGCSPGAKTDSAKPATGESSATSSKQTTGGKPGASDQKTGDSSVKTGTKKSASKQSKPQTPAQPLTIPTVAFTDALRATCLVNVGDVMPQGELVAADESQVSLQTKYGQKLTVLFFWEESGSNYAKLAAASALKDLQTDIAEPYAEKAVKVVGINVGDNPQSVRQELERVGVSIPYYFDPDKAFFDKVAKSILPRIYLLDASGKIIWFDTEYSQATRRNLMQAIEVVLGEK